MRQQIVVEEQCLVRLLFGGRHARRPVLREQLIDRLLHLLVGQQLAGRVAGQIPEHREDRQHDEHAAGFVHDVVAQNIVIILQSRRHLGERAGVGVLQVIADPLAADAVIRPHVVPGDQRGVTDVLVERRADVQEPTRPWQHVRGFGRLRGHVVRQPPPRAANVLPRQRRLDGPSRGAIAVDLVVEPVRRGEFRGRRVGYAHHARAVVVEFSQPAREHVLMHVHQAIKAVVFGGRHGGLEVVEILFVVDAALVRFDRFPLHHEPHRVEAEFLNQREVLVQVLDRERLADERNRIVDVRARFRVAEIDAVDVEVAAVTILEEGLFGADAGHRLVELLLRQAAVVARDDGEQHDGGKRRGKVAHRSAPVRFGEP